MMFISLLVVFSVLASTLASTNDYSSQAWKHLLGNFQSTEKGEGDLTMVTDAGMENFLVQAMGYAENKCAKGSAFFAQRIAGGQCVNTSDGGKVKSQLLGCTPAEEGSTKFTINYVQFTNANCEGMPFQAVAQFQDETDCTAVDNDNDSPYEQSLAMKFVAAGEQHALETGGLLTDFYGPADTTCSTSANLVQGVISGACLKGTETTDAGVKVPTNTSETISCLSASEYVVHLYDQPGCQGEATQNVPQPVKMPECTAGVTSKGALSYEKMMCFKPAN